jgi:hypothetical protein
MKLRRQHEAFLRARDGDVDAPGVHLERHGAERGDRIDRQQRAVASGAHGLADARDVVDDAGGGIDLHDEHGLNRTGLVLAQPCL